MSAFVINPYAFAGPTFEFAYLGAYTDAANLTTYTFNSVDFGVADANRHIVVAFASRAGNLFTVSSASIGGVSATIDVQASQSGSGGNTAAIIRANIATGTSGTVSVTLSAGSARAAIGVYRIVASNFAVVDTDSATGGSSNSRTVDTGVGAVIAASADASSATTWTNLTENADGIVEFLNYSWASGASTAGTLAVTCNSGLNNALAVASYS